MSDNAISEPSGIGAGSIAKVGRPHKNRYRESIGEGRCGGGVRHRRLPHYQSVLPFTRCSCIQYRPTGVDFLLDHCIDTDRQRLGNDHKILELENKHIISASTAAVSMLDSNETGRHECPLVTVTDKIKEVFSRANYNMLVIFCVLMGYGAQRLSVQR